MRMLRHVLTGSLFVYTDALAMNQNVEAVDVDFDNLPSPPAPPSPPPAPRTIGALRAALMEAAGTDVEAVYEITDSRELRALLADRNIFVGGIASIRVLQDRLAKAIADNEKGV